MGLWLLQNAEGCGQILAIHLRILKLVEMASRSKTFQSIIDPDWMKFYNPVNMVKEIKCIL